MRRLLDWHSGCARRLAPASVLLLSLASPARAATAETVYDNGAPIPSIANGFSVTAFLVADDFVVPATREIRSATVFVGRQSFQPLSDSDRLVTYVFLADDGGRPGREIVRGVVRAATVADSGVDWYGGVNSLELSFNLAAAFSAEGGTRYWIGIHLGAEYTPLDDILWVPSAVDSGNAHVSWFGTLDNWEQQLAWEMAFRLDGDRVVASPSDADEDGFADSADNCPNDFNPDQFDRDLDLVGDACDPFPDQPDNAQAQCEADLADAVDELAQCLATQAVDADRDGERDDRDSCPDTRAGVAIDDSGCSHQQFCEAIPITAPVGLMRCLRADWQNDEPLAVFTHDCQWARKEAGAGLMCAPR